MWERVSRLIRAWMPKTEVEKRDRPKHAVDRSQFWREVRDGEREATNQAASTRGSAPTGSASRRPTRFVDMADETGGSDR
jgi:hypothetical protein